MAKRKLESYLISRIPLKAVLVGSLGEVKASLKEYPHIKLLSERQGLRYLLQVESLEDRFYTICFNADSVILELHSRASPHYFLQESILRLLSILMLLADNYEFNTASILPYVIELLGREQIRRHSEKIREDAKPAPSDIILASRINRLLKENSALKERGDALESKERRAVSCLILARYGVAGNIDDVAKESLLEREDIVSALEHMPELGYRAIKESQNRFSLVRL